MEGFVVIGGGCGRVLSGSVGLKRHVCGRVRVSGLRCRGRWEMRDGRKEQKQLVEGDKGWGLGVMGMAWKMMVMGMWALAVLPAGRASAAEMLDGSVGVRRAGVVAMAASTKTGKTGTAQKPSKLEKKELSAGERLVSVTMTSMGVVGMFVWAFKANRKEDEDEEIRIKNEVERLDKLKKEFLDVEQDDESVDDEDMMAELRKRLASPSVGSNEDGNPDAKGPDEEAPAEPRVGEDSRPSAGDRQSSAVMDRDESENSAASAENIEKLKRMWNLSDD